MIRITDLGGGGASSSLLPLIMAVIILLIVTYRHLPPGPALGTLGTFSHYNNVKYPNL